MVNKASDGLYNSQNELAKHVNVLLGNHAMEGPKCCFCMPIKPGLIFIYCYIMMDMIQSTVVTLSCWEVHMILFGFNFCGLVPIIIANKMWYNYFRGPDNFETRSRLIMACGLMILAQLFQYFGVLAASMLTDKVPLNAVVFNFSVNALQIMSYSYFLFVC